MKVALVHDYIKEYGGAERVLEALHEMYPDAPVYTSIYLPSYLGPHRERFKDWNIQTSWMQYIPFNAKLISPFRLLSPWLFKSFDFSEYDVIISSATGAYFPNSLNKKSAKLICYCHTPPRYLYGYATARNWKKNKIIAGFASVANHFLRMADFNASKNVDQYVANSEEVAGRIKKFYRREAIVVYPPVVTSLSSLRKRGSDSRLPSKRTSFSEAAHENDSNKEYYLTGGRLARAKHIEVIVEACKELGVPLKVFGKAFAGYGEELQELAKSKEGRAIHSASSGQESEIEFLGEVSDEEKFELLRNAKAFLFASEDEDFGIAPVEAMGVGVPVIAYKSGGVKETVIDEKTGVFYEENTPEYMISAIKKFEKMKIDPKDCERQAEKFSKEKFVEEIKKVVEEKK